jgi:hypothetical protein
MWRSIGLFLIPAAVAVAQLPADHPSAMSSQDQLCSIRGRVMSASGQPLRRAEVTIRPDGMRPPDVTYAASTAADGSFVFENLPAGQYRASAKRIGYVEQVYGPNAGETFGNMGVTLTLASGETLQNIDFKLLPQAIIAGRITDDDGEPAENILVMLLRENRLRGENQIVPSGAQGFTNDLGEFRIAGVAPGTYYLCANWGGFRGPTQQRVVRQGPEETIPEVYYPGTLDRAEAKAIEVAAGAQIRSADFQLRKVRAFRVRGRVVAPEDADLRTLMTQLMPRMTVKSGWSVTLGGSMSHGNETIDFGGVLPGSYDVIAHCQAGGRQLSARFPVEVTDRNIEGLVVTFKSAAGVTIEGVVRAAGEQPAGFNPAGIHVSLRNLDEAQLSAGGSALRNGSLTFQNLVPGRYEVSVYSPPEDGYLKSVKYLDREVPDRVIEIGASGEGTKLEVLMAFDGGEATGVVEDTSGTAVPGAAVFLYPKSQGKGVSLQTATTDQHGRYLLRGIPPGEYSLLAVPAADLESVWGGGSLEEHEADATRVSIAPGSKSTVALKLASSNPQPH